MRILIAITDIYMMAIRIRSIRQEDNAALAKIIRDIFIEFDAPLTGTVYSDPQTDHLYEVFAEEKCAYFVAEEDGVVLGGCGVYPTDGLPEGCAELVKFYLSPASRGKGLGRTLMERSFEAAKELGYRQLYLESFPQLATAVGMYKKAGFYDIPEQLGNSGHYATTVWMLKDLD
jgi:putative acetyltransferase